VAVTGELSIAGNVRPVGGIVEKLYAARQAGMRLVLLPRENARDVDTSIGGIEVVLVSTVAEALAALAVAPGLRRPARRPRKAVR
jgi:ATP-dependent Lon protease